MEPKFKEYKITPEAEELKEFVISSRRTLRVGDTYVPTRAARRVDGVWPPQYENDPWRKIVRLVNLKNSKTNSVKIYYVDSNGKTGRCGQHTWSDWMHLHQAKVKNDG